MVMFETFVYFDCVDVCRNYASITFLLTGVKKLIRRELHYIMSQGNII